jgi:hypothetical protein
MIGQQKAHHQLLLLPHHKTSRYIQKKEFSFKINDIKVRPCIHAADVQYDSSCCAVLMRTEAKRDDLLIKEAMSQTLPPLPGSAHRIKFASLTRLLAQERFYILIKF